MAGIDFIHQNGVDYEIVPEIAPLFKTTVAYHTGDHVIYEAGWYTFKADKSAGAWDATKVNGPFKVSERLTNLKEDLNAKVDINQGVAHAGEALIVGSDGTVTTGDAGVNAQKTQALWSVVKLIGAFTNTDGASAVSAFKSAWGAYDTVEITGVDVSGDVSNFITGTTRQLTATLTPTVTEEDQYEEHTIAWSSSNTSVATVDANGLVSAISAGETRITCTVTANSGTYTDYVDATITGEQTPLYTLPQGTGNYTGDYGSLAISGNSVTYNCTHHVGSVRLNLALLPDGTYLPNAYTPNANALFSISNGDEMRIEVSDISYQFSDMQDGIFNFCLMDESNAAINSAGKQPIYLTARPEGTSVSGVKVANRDAEIHGVRAEIYTKGTGTLTFSIKVYINGARYY